MKPDKRIEGRNKKGHLHRLHLAPRDGGDGVAEGDIGGDEEERRGEQQEQRARHRHVEEELARDQDDRDLDEAEADIGHDLAGHDLVGARRHGEQVLDRAALDLAGERERGHQDRRHGQDDAEQAGDDVVRGDALGIVAAVDDDFDGKRPRREAGKRADRLARERAAHDLVEGAERIGGRGRVGGVGLDEELRPLAADQGTLEVRREW